jgi:hypothetical protein
MMATGQTGDREIPQVVTHFERVGMIGARSADTIKARGHAAPQPETGHMTAPQNRSRHQENPCTKGAVHT